MSETAAPEAVGPGEWDMQVTWRDTDDLMPNRENPNTQDDRTFNALVASIQRDGWTGPVSVVEDKKIGKFEIVAGEHRWRAARIMGCKVPCIDLRPEVFEQDRRDMSVVKDNILKGTLDPVKFTALYGRLKDRYNDEVLKSLMGFTSEDAFTRVYKEVVAGLPPGLAEALANSKEEIRTIDDLSVVLNRLFRDHGETLDSNFMVFSFGGKEVLWVRASKPLWVTVSEMASRAHEDGADLAEVLNDRLSAPVVMAATAEDA